MKNVFKLFGTQSRWLCAIALAAGMLLLCNACGGGSRTVTYRGAADDGSIYTLKITEAAQSAPKVEAEAEAALTVTGPYLAFTPRTLTRNVFLSASDPGSAGDAFTPSVGDSYVLTVGRKKSTGEVQAVAGSTFKLQPKAPEAEAFDATVSDNGLTNVKGLITFDDGSEEEGPGELTPNTPVVKDKTDDESPSSDDGKLSGKLIKTFQGNQYHMVTKTHMMGMEIVSDMYYKNGMTAVTTNTMGMNMTSITKDNKVYSILHDMKTYMVMDIPKEKKSESDNMYYKGQKFTGSGKAMFDGKERAYEEYTYDDKNSKIVIRYFFNGSDFAGVSIKTDKTQVIEMVVLSFNSSVPSNAFDIPKGYSEMQGMQGLSDMMKGFN